MQRPRRGSKRQSKEKEVAWRGGLGRDEVVWLVAQEASAEVMVAGVGYRRKKKKLQRREKGWKEKRESCGSCAYCRWGFGFVVRLRCRLLVEEEGLCGVFKGWRSSGREREKRERWLEEKKQGRSCFFGLFWTRFSPPSGHQIHLYL